jgi:hypothetical protein
VGAVSVVSPAGTAPVRAREPPPKKPARDTSRFSVWFGVSASSPGAASSAGPTAADTTSRSAASAAGPAAAGTTSSPAVSLAADAGAIGMASAPAAGATWGGRGAGTGAGGRYTYRCFCGSGGSSADQRSASSDSVAAALAVTRRPRTAPRVPHQTARAATPTRTRIVSSGGGSSSADIYRECRPEPPGTAISGPYVPALGFSIGAPMTLPHSVQEPS